MLHLREGSDKGRTTDRIKNRRKKVKHPGGFEPTTYLFQGVCSTVVLQALPTYSNRLQSSQGNIFVRSSRNPTRFQISRQKSRSVLPTWRSTSATGSSSGATWRVSPSPGSCGTRGGSESCPRSGRTSGCTKTGPWFSGSPRNVTSRCTGARPRTTSARTPPRTGRSRLKVAFWSYASYKLKRAYTSLNVPKQA